VPRSSLRGNGIEAIYDCPCHIAELDRVAKRCIILVIVIFYGIWLQKLGVPLRAGFLCLLCRSVKNYACVVYSYWMYIAFYICLISELFVKCNLITLLLYVRLFKFLVACMQDVKTMLMSFSRFSKLTRILGVCEFITNQVTRASVRSHWQLVRVSTLFANYPSTEIVLQTTFKLAEKVASIMDEPEPFLPRAYSSVQLFRNI
jgi:hypothetical protein